MAMTADDGATRLANLAGALYLLTRSGTPGPAERARQRAAERVRDACRKAREELRAGLLADARVPLLVNYRERYAALARKNDAQEVLRLLRATLDLVPLALERADVVDVPAAASDAAAAYAQALARVTGGDAGLSGAWKGRPLLGEGELPAFPGVPAGEPSGRAVEVRALAQEVDAAFARFSEVVRDNGLFAAFPDTCGFTACAEWDEWDEDDDGDDARDVGFG